MSILSWEYKREDAFRHSLAQDAVPNVQYHAPSPTPVCTTSAFTPQSSFLTSDPPLARNKTLTKVQNTVQRIRDLHTTLSPRALSLSVASHLRDTCGLNVRLYVDVSMTVANIPPGWLDGLIVVTDTCGGDVIYVDCTFRAKFQVARSTARFQQYLSLHVPTVFVGLKGELHAAVDTVMDELKRSLWESGLETAPWRTLQFVKAAYNYCLQSQWHLRGEDLMNDVRGYMAQSDIPSSVTACSEVLCEERPDAAQNEKYHPGDAENSGFEDVRSRSSWRSVSSVEAESEYVIEKVLTSHEVDDHLRSNLSQVLKSHTQCQTSSFATSARGVFSGIGRLKSKMKQFLKQ